MGRFGGVYHAAAPHPRSCRLHWTARSGRQHLCGFDRCGSDRPYRCSGGDWNTGAKRFKW